MKYSELERKLKNGRSQTRDTEKYPQRCRNMKTLNVIIERGLDKGFSAYIKDSNDFGCIGEGQTAKEAENDFLQGLEDLRRAMERDGRKMPDVRCKFTYDISSFLSYYANAFSLSGLQRITGVNQRQLSHYLNGVRKPSRMTAEKIEHSIKDFATEILQTDFLIK